MTTNKKKVATDLKKAKGMIEKILKMLEEDNYCIDIMQQNLAVVGILKSAHQKLFENHLETCFQTALGSTNEEKKKKMMKEILTVTKLFNK